MRPGPDRGDAASANEKEFEVDQNRVGKRWRVTLFRNGSVVFRGIRTTVAPSGSFDVHRLLAGSAGTSRIVAKATALKSGETCRASRPRGEKPDAEQADHDDRHEADGDVPQHGLPDLCPPQGECARSARG